MDNKTITTLALLGVGGFILYKVLGQKAQAQPQGYTPSSGGGSGSGSGKKKEITILEIIALVNQTLDVYSNVKLTYDQKITAVKEIKQLIDQGKSQQQIEIIIGNKYGLTPTQIRAIVDKL